MGQHERDVLEARVKTMKRERLIFVCPACGKTARATLGERGKVRKCENCQTPIVVPMQPMPLWMSVLYRLFRILNLARSA